MSDVVFITPNFGKDLKEEPLGTLILLSILQEKGVDAEIIQMFRFGDINDFDNYLEHSAELILERNPKIVSFYTRCDLYHVDIKMAEVIKTKRPDIYIVFGGPHSDLCAYDTINEIPYVDFVCCGEGETTIHPFFSSLIAGKVDYSVPGLVYRNGEEVIVNSRPALINDLDSIPFVNKLMFSNSDVDYAKHNSCSIDVGRGCPFSCTYCSTKKFWGRKYRIKSAERIVQEIKLLHEESGISRFSFEHDMFTMNRSYILEVCELLKTLDFKIKWVCSARADCLDEELIDSMIDSGLSSIFIGIETGSSKMQKMINKKLDLEKAWKLIQYIDSKGLSILASFIYGFPEEEEYDISQTIDFISKLLRLNHTEIETTLCTFLPGTELSEKYFSEMTLVKPYEDIAHGIGVTESWDLISNHPKLFQHFFDYKTELRTDLKYFGLFMSVWSKLKPIYNYYAEFYESERMIEMYHDFVESNKEVLEEYSNLPKSELVRKLLEKDKFRYKFSCHEFDEIIDDYYRIKYNTNRDDMSVGDAITEIFCISPNKIKKKRDIRDIVKETTVVTYSKINENKLVLKELSI